MSFQSSSLRIYETPRQSFDIEDRFALLKKVASSISTGKEPYENHAEQIEDLSYLLCKHGDSEPVVKVLSEIVSFFENLENKNEENSRDLADVYLLIGQLYQFTEKYEESVAWFKKAAIVDDQYTVSFHNIALSYIKLGEIEGAIRSLVQEVMFSPGNYYSYLILADLYESSERYSEAEHCLRQLLERDPFNIQGLHRLIRYYNALDTTIDVQLLIRRLLSIKKPFTSVEYLIRTYYFHSTGCTKDAIKCTEQWRLFSPKESVHHLVRAFIFEKNQLFEESKNELEMFRNCFKNRDSEIMRAKINEFCIVFGENNTKNIKNALLTT